VLLVLQEVEDATDDDSLNEVEKKKKSQAALRSETLNRQTTRVARGLVDDMIARKKVRDQEKARKLHVKEIEEERRKADLAPGLVTDTGDDQLLDADISPKEIRARRYVPTNQRRKTLKNTDDSSSDGDSEDLPALRDDVSDGDVVPASKNSVKKKKKKKKKKLVKRKKKKKGKVSFQPPNVAQRQAIKTASLKSTRGKFSFVGSKNYVDMTLGKFHVCGLELFF
jgi:hypothetical protein